MIEPAPLPYAYSALRPTLSTEAVRLHYEAHYRRYVERVNELTTGTMMADWPLVRIVGHVRPGSRLFDNANQAWNHEFFFNCMRPKARRKPAGEIGRLIDRDFGSLEDFRTAFVRESEQLVGSGWLWLYHTSDGLRIAATPNAYRPQQYGLTNIPLLAVDLWEHAYYLDFHADRSLYVQQFLDRLVYWPFVNSVIDSRR